MTSDNQAKLLDQLSIDYPIIQLPLHDADSAELIAEVANHGGLGTLAAGFLSAAELRDRLDEISALTDRSFAVNLFANVQKDEDSEGMTRALNRISPVFEGSDIALTTLLSREGRLTDLDTMLDVIFEYNVSAVSFSLGVPSDEILSRIKERGITIIGHATHMLEALFWEEKGADIIYLQGLEASGIRDTFLGDPMDVAQPALTLIAQANDNLTVPYIIGGGLVNKTHIDTAFALGAPAVGLATAFLMSHESGADELYKNALSYANEFDIKITREWSGYPARVVVNWGLRQLQALEGEPARFPAQYFLTHPMMEDKAPEDRAQFRALWANVNAPFAERLPVRQLMTELLGVEYS